MFQIVSCSETQPRGTLFQATRGYTAQIDGELSFEPGTFVKELSDVSSFHVIQTLIFIHLDDVVKLALLCLNL